MKTSDKKERKIITDKLVIEKTKKPLEYWFIILDKKGAKKMSHEEIFALVSTIEGLKPLGQWNQNLLATSYEWNRGLKERGQKEDGFEISVSKTIAAPIQLLFDSWINSTTRNKWLMADKIRIRKSTENKSARITWTDNETSLSVDFYSKGENKSMVVVQHLKMQTSKYAYELKDYWGNALEKLKSFLEK
jgi:hypothetical protein